MSDVRDALRAKVLSTKKPGSVPVTFFGAALELRQPTLADILEVKGTEDDKGAIISTLVRYAYVPGTDERLFEEGDADTLLAMPFGPDFIAVTNALQELTSVNFLDKKPSSTATDSDSQ